MFKINKVVLLFSKLSCRLIDFYKNYKDFCNKYKSLLTNINLLSRFSFFRK
jgi:hypothetical protein